MANLLRAVFVVALLALGVGAFVWLQRPVAEVSTPAVVTRMREVARLETLDVTVYKKVSYEPDLPAPTSLAGDVLAWARHTVAPKRGRAIVFGVAHVGLDLSKLGEDDVRIVGSTIEVTLPAPEVRVEVQPQETEIVSSNLDSAQTTALLEKGRAALEQDVRSDVALRERSRASSERALRALLTTLGFRDIRFTPPRAPGDGARPAGAAAPTAVRTRT